MKAQKKTAAASAAGTASLKTGEIQKMTSDVPQWTLRESAIQREFQFGDFRSAIEFVNRVADLAEEEDHHPDILVFYSKVRLVLSTHKAGGLSQKDFAMARKIDRLTQQDKQDI